MKQYDQNALQNSKSNLLIKISKKLINLPRLFLLEKKNYFANKKFLKKIDCLIISSIIHEDNIEGLKDFYYGNLQNNLQEKYGLKTLTAYRNFSKLSNKVIYKKLKNKECNVILSKRISIINEISLIFQTLKEYLIFKIFRKTNIDINFINFFTIPPNLRISIQILKLVKNYKPKIIIFTFEGHAWERVLIKKIKSNINNVILAAYQFSVISNNQHSIFRSLQNNYNPDIIFTSGELTKKLFEVKMTYTNTKLYVLGSNKHNNSIKKYNIDNNKYCFLITPEAYEEENKILLKFAISCAHLFKNIKFIFRFHPSMTNHKSLINEVGLEKINLNRNFIFSNSNLKKDFDRATHIIYRGSATVFEACSRGIFPVYYNYNNETNINPLYQFYDKELAVNIPEDLEKYFLKKYVSLYRNHFLKLTNKYFSPMKENIIYSILNNKNDR